MLEIGEKSVKQLLRLVDFFLLQKWMQQNTPSRFYTLGCRMQEWHVSYLGGILKKQVKNCIPSCTQIWADVGMRLLELQ